HAVAGRLQFHGAGVVAEVRGEGRRDPTGRLLVVDRGRKRGGPLDQGLLGAAGRPALRLDDAADGVQDPGAGRLVERADVDLEDGPAGDDGGAAPGVDAADGQHGRRRGGQLAGDHGLQAQHVAAAVTTGSTAAWGMEPCAPRPRTVTRRLSAADRKGPARVPTCPAGWGRTCWARTTSGRGDLAVRPSAIMGSAPSPFSSEGWKRATKAPRQVSRCRASSRAQPVGQAVCTSCPQACMTGCSTPSRAVAVAVDAYGRPVRSRTGRASMSARAMTTGPSPFARTPITPVPPTPSVTA